MRHKCFVLEEIGKWSPTEQRIFWFYTNTEGMTRLYTAYQQKQNQKQYSRSEWPKVKSSVERIEKEDKTVIAWLKDSDELVKVANKTLEGIRSKYFFRRCKRNIGGTVLRKHGISWVRIGDGIFVPTADGEKYPVSMITGVLFEHQHPHPFSLP